MNFLYSLLELVVLPSLTDEAREQIKKAYSQLTQKSWETIFLEAFQSAFSEQKPFLQRYSDGIVELSEEDLRKVLNQDIQIQVDDKSITELTSSDLVERISISIFEGEILKIGGHTLSKEEYLSLVSNIVKCAQAKFKQSIIQNEITFRQAIFKQTELNNEYLSEIQDFLKKEFNYIFLVDKKLDGITEVTHEIKGSIDGLSKQVEAIKKDISKNVLDVTEDATSQKEVRDSKLKELLNESKGRCIANWMAVGVTQEVALSFYKDETIGYPLPNIYSRKVSILEGDFGVGKTLIVERFLQKFIFEALGNENASIPIYLHAHEIKNNLPEIILGKSKDYGDVKKQGAIVIIEKIDESGKSESIDIIKQVRELSVAWNDVSFIIPTRPLADVYQDEERIIITGLKIQEIRKLVEIITGQDSRSFQIDFLPPPIRDALSRPLFALLWANYIKKSRNSNIKSVGELISFLVEEAIKTSSYVQEDKYELLEALAIKSTNIGGDYIDNREIGYRDQINSLTSSRLIEKIGDRIGFPIPIISQWFAARGLINRKINIATVVNDQNLLEKWRYPLEIFLTSAPYEISFPIFSLVVKADPGFAASIINESIVKYSLEDNKISMTEMECGSRILSSMIVLCDSIADLSKEIGPLRGDGEIRSVGIKINNYHLSQGWFDSDKSMGEIFVINPSNLGNPSLGRMPRRLITSIIPSQPGWPWSWNLDYLRDNIKDKFKTKSIFIKNGWIYKEQMWVQANKLLGKGELNEKGLSVLDLEDKFKNYYGDNWYKHKYSKFNLLMDYVLELKMEGVFEIKPLWPTRDIDSVNHSLWEYYSDDQIMQRAQIIFSLAIEEYTNIALHFFEKLSTRLWHFVLLPASFKGYLFHDQIPYYGNPPEIKWIIEPLPKERQSSIEIVQDMGIKVNGSIGKLYEDLVKMRPQHRSWIYGSNIEGVDDLFHEDPLTRIVYKWLESDLRRINWIV